eukprot:SAG25_NODE_737_length_5642_cov_2.285225_3_plen_107_part_00
MAPQSDLIKRLNMRLLRYHTIDGLGCDTIIRKGRVPDVKVEESRAHGHNCTTISGLETYGLDVGEFAAHVKKKLKCTASVAPMPGKNNPNKEISVQGRASTFFCNQ